jgi:predicted metallo-beta-lactamase superfamily hydrolase
VTVREIPEVGSLKKIQFLPLASESMGVRSMCVFIKTPDLSILVDPGVSMSRRWGLLPHPQEYRLLMECRERIAQFADRSEVIAISHYHFDHCTPSFTDYVWNFSSLEVAKQIFQDKVMLTKDARSHINPGQRRRGWLFKKTLGAFVKDIQVADGNVFTFGKTKIDFSNPVFHGEENTPMGWVLMMRVDFGGECVMHTSDVQGPMLDETLDLILSANPDLVHVGGPPLYLADFRVDRQLIEKGIKNLTKLASEIQTVIVDHHLLRDEAWRDYSKDIFKTAQMKGNRVVTAAEFICQEDRLLESRRRQIYEDEPPSVEFLNWTRLSREKRRTIRPPL